MSACLPYIQPIYPAECLSDSLRKINLNFANLQEEVCTIKETVDSMVEVRTFWYYGPNAQNDPSSDMETGIASRPSDNTIKAFVNSPEQLNLPEISDINDIAFVVFQKTGFKNSLFNDVTVAGEDALRSSESRMAREVLRRIPVYRTTSSGRRVFVRFVTRLVTITTDYSSLDNSFGEHTGNLLNEFAPTFFIWRLTFDGTEYVVTPGSPAVMRGEAPTSGARIWNQPQTWTTY